MSMSINQTRQQDRTMNWFFMLFLRGIKRKSLGGGKNSNNIFVFHNNGVVGEDGIGGVDREDKVGRKDFVYLGFGSHC